MLYLCFTAPTSAPFETWDSQNNLRRWDSYCIAAMNSFSFFKEIAKTFPGFYSNIVRADDWWRSITSATRTRSIDKTSA